jgi:hypothetical protein
MSESKLGASPQRVAELTTEARYARVRYDLYRARRIYGSGQSSPSKLRRLEHASQYADARLKRARDVA